MYADLHIHTYFSDGSQSPEEAAKTAKERGLHIISVCDHNTAAAYERLRPACEKEGLQLIQGAELEVILGDERLHVLAYNFNPAHPPLMRLMAYTQNEYARINHGMIEDMARDFPKVSVDEYAAYTMPLGRGGWKSINYLYDLGLANSVEDAMKWHKKYGKYAPSFYSLEEACHIIREAGGVPVLAHPGVYWDEQILPDKLRRLSTTGIAGIECYYPWHSEKYTDMCVRFCQKNNWRVTCGGDGHGGFFKVVEGCLYDIGVMKVDTTRLSLTGIL